MDLLDQEGITLETLLERLKHLTEERTLRDFALFHQIVSLPKPTYMKGLNEEAEAFIEEQAVKLNSKRFQTYRLNRIDPINSSIRFHGFSVVFLSHVRRTKQTHAIQQAFGISPDRIESPVLRDFSIEIQPGQIVLITGPSGSGKTTLLNAMQLNKGSISQLEKIAHLEGSLELPTNYRPSAFSLIRSQKALIEVLGDKNVDKALSLMGIVGLSDAYVYLKRFEELSNGQQFRAVLAKLIASDANVWFIDEFCANLDVVTANVVADKIQRTARKLGITVIAAAPHYQFFLHSFQPDQVIQLTTAWEHKIISGRKFMKEMQSPRVVSAHMQILTLKPEYFREIRAGRKRATIRQGRLKISKGLLLFERGNSDKQVVIVTSVKCCQVKKLTLEDAIDDGYADLESLKEDLFSIYPKLKENHYVTVIRYDTLVTTPHYLDQALED